MYTERGGKISTSETRGFNSFEVLADEVKKKRKKREKRLEQILSLLQEEIEEEEEEKTQEILQKQADWFTQFKEKQIPEEFSPELVSEKLTKIETQLDKILKSTAALTINSVSTILSTSSINPSSSASNVQAIESDSYSQAVKNKEKKSQKTESSTKEEKLNIKSVKIQKFSHQARKLVLKTSIKALETLNLQSAYNFRNLINDQFFYYKKAEKPVLASVSKSFSGKSLLLTTMSEFSADFLLENQEIWQQPLQEALNATVSIQNSQKWGKIVIHGIPTSIYNQTDGLYLLEQEIKDFNPDLEIQKSPFWLTSWEKRETSQTASIALFVKNKEQASKPYVFIAGLMLRVHEFKESNSKLSIQCTNCQKYGHTANFCFRQVRCQICAKNHHTKEHICHICKKQGNPCIHTKPQCSNCKESHSSNSSECSFYPKKATEEDQSNLKRKLEKDGLAIVISNKKITKC